MTTNQTIDGVPREAVAALEKSRNVLRAIIRDKAAGVHYASAQAACHQINSALDELRALLDANAEPKPTGLSQGWNLTRKHDGFVVGHQSVAYPPDEKAIERAEREGYVWVPFLLPATQLQGEPVARVEIGADRNAALTITDDNWLRSLKDRGTHQIVPLYAAQPQGETPDDDKSHPRFIAGYTAGLHDYKLGQPQGEPVAYRWRVKGHGEWTASVCKVEFDARANDDRFVAQALYAEQPAPVAVNSQAMADLRHIFDSNKGADGTLVISKKLAAQILNPSL